MRLYRLPRELKGADGIRDIVVKGLRIVPQLYVDHARGLIIGQLDRLVKVRLLAAFFDDFGARVERRRGALVNILV